MNNAVGHSAMGWSITSHALRVVQSLSAGPWNHSRRAEEGSQPVESVNALEVVLRINLAQALIKLTPGTADQTTSGGTPMSAAMVAANT